MNIPDDIFPRETIFWDKIIKYRYLILCGSRSVIQESFWPWNRNPGKTSQIRNTAIVFCYFMKTMFLNGMKPTNRLQELLKVSYTAKPTQLNIFKWKSDLQIRAHLHRQIVLRNFYLTRRLIFLSLSAFTVSTLGVENTVLYATMSAQPIKGCKIT